MTKFAEMAEGYDMAVYLDEERQEPEVTFAEYWSWFFPKCRERVSRHGRPAIIYRAPIPEMVGVSMDLLVEKVQNDTR